MILFRSILATALASVALSASAQDLLEAYNLSNMSVQGTARSIGFGNALGSVGGDYSAVSVNPAGLGIYRSSELSLTTSLKINGASSQYLNTGNNDYNVKMNINHFAIVFNDAPKGKRYDRRDWKTMSFTIGMNRVADFNHDYTYTGTNKSSSLSQAFEANANMDSNNVSTLGTLGYLGYQSYLINGSPEHYTTAVPFKEGVQQLNNVKERGGITEYLFSLGGNYKEKVLVGMSVGIPYMDYKRTSVYSETLLPNTTNNPELFQSFTYKNTLNVFGGGINVKLGAIYNLTEFFRVGAAFHSPTFYSIKEFTDFGIASKINGKSFDISTSNYLSRTNFDYSFTTPYKAILSATLVLKKIGFVTADYEYINYNSMRYHYPSGYDSASGITYDYQAVVMNRSIKDAYKSTNNIRIGAEIKLTKFFMVRGGVGYYGNPYKTAALSGAHVDISGGLGFRTPHFFADLGLVTTYYSFNEQPYNQIDYTFVRSGTAAGFPTAKIDQYLNNFAFTIGTKF